MYGLDDGTSAGPGGWEVGAWNCLLRWRIFRVFIGVNFLPWERIGRKPATTSILRNCLRRNRPAREFPAGTGQHRNFCREISDYGNLQILLYCHCYCYYYYYWPCYIDPKQKQTLLKQKLSLLLRSETVNVTPPPRNQNAIHLLP